MSDPANLAAYVEFLLIVPVGIEMLFVQWYAYAHWAFNRTSRNWNQMIPQMGIDVEELLIVPVGIEIFFGNNGSSGRIFLLIVPVGIEMNFF